MICLECAALRDRGWRERCPDCGAALVCADAEGLERLVEARLRLRLRAWKDEGLLGDSDATRLASTLPEPPRAPRAPTWQERADQLSDALPTAESLRPSWVDSIAEALRPPPPGEARDPHDAAGEPTSDHGDDQEHATGTARALLQHQGPSPLDGLDAVTGLDEGHGPRPFLTEYVWWFIGTLLVLGGSVMGVREAWRALAGVPRLLVVASALYGYHAGFAGLSALVGRRSARAGRALGAISLGLLPVVFSALSALVALHPGAGLASSAVALALSALSLRSLSGRFEGASLASLGLALVGSLVAVLPLSLPDLAPAVRLSLPSLALGSLALTVWRGVGRGRVLPDALETALTALYGALFVGVFAVAGAPGAPSLGVSPGDPGAAAICLWLTLTGAVAALGASTEPSRTRWPGASATLEVSALALVALAALAASLGALSRPPGLDPALDALLALVPALGACLFAWQHRARPGAMHPAVVLGALGGYLVARLASPSLPGYWPTGVASVAAALFVLARLAERSHTRVRLALWGSALGLGAVGAALRATLLPTQEPWPWVALPSVIVALSAHAMAGRSLRGLHLLGGLSAVVAAASWWVPGASLQGALALVLGSASWVYLAWGALERRREASEKPSDFNPLEDLSAVAGLLALPLLPRTLAPPVSVLSALPAAVVGVALGLGAARDRTRVMSSASACALALGAWVLASPVSAANRALVGGALALTFALAAAAVGGSEGSEEGARARPLLGALSLPFHARGRGLYGDGLAVASLLSACVSVAGALAWLAARVEGERGLALAGTSLVVVTGLVAFGTRGFRGLRARGAAVTLAVTGLAGVLAALVNRLGRPLPPAIVGRNLLAIIPVAWLLAVALRRWGPRLALALDRPEEGARYHLVPHAAVAGLGALLLVDAALVGAPSATRALVTVPPFFFLGALVSLALLGRSTGRARVLTSGLALAAPLGALVAAQRSLVGPSLVPLTPPGGRWVREATELACRARGWLDPGAFLPAGETVASVWLQATRGVAVSGLALAALLAFASEPARGAWLSRVALQHPGMIEQDRLRQDLERLSGLCLALVVVSGALQPDLASGALTVLLGLTLRLAGAKWWSRAGLVLGGLLVHGAMVHRNMVHPSWAGPSLALVVPLAVLALPEVARRRDTGTDLARARADALSLGLGLVALVHALASGGPTDPRAAAPRVLANALLGLTTSWPSSPALPLTLGALTLGLALSAAGWRGALSRWWSAGAALLGSLTVLTALAVARGRTLAFDPARLYADLVSREGLEGALAVALCAAVSHALAAGLSARREDLSRGLSLARDALLVGAGVLLAWAMTTQSGARSLATGEATAAVGFLVAVLAARAGRAPRHVYAAQVAVVMAYALVSSRAGGPLPPAADPIFGLALGFVLVGVTVLARRAGIPPVAAATRRFAGLLPVAIAVARSPSALDREAALTAAGAAVFYATMALTERSRWFGALAAVAGNLALLALMLAEGLQGAEVFLGPLGLLVLVLVQLFSGSLSQRARRSARLVGGLSLYLPAAMKLSFGLGQARDAGYPLVFGAVCLLGAAAGVTLQIRAFLALGTLFLTLDVASVLLHAGLRDHRVGFVVLSVAGLAVLGATVYATLHRERVSGWMRALRQRLAGWE